jgi:hemoglobin
MTSPSPENQPTLPEAAAPLGASLEMRSVGAGARVQIPVVPTASSVPPASAGPSAEAAPGGSAQAAAGTAPDEAAQERLDPASVYVQAGGEATFHALVAAFYRGIADDPLLRPMYPEEDLGPAEERMRLFLIQYFGGPTTYSQRRGHPRLRMRHFPFAVNQAAREAWLRHMRAALDEVALSPMLDGIMWDYFERAATAMINTPG